MIQADPQCPVTHRQKYCSRVNSSSPKSKVAGGRVAGTRSSSGSLASSGEDLDYGSHCFIEVAQAAALGGAVMLAHHGQHFTQHARHSPPSVQLYLILTVLAFCKASHEIKNHPNHVSTHHHTSDTTTKTTPQVTPPMTPPAWRATPCHAPPRPPLPLSAMPLNT
ncbi:hypothetical protein E2C01_017741 [Portunus trituberculatus]|uniref:Uncharacterized protein n=1 Tax=Portunus trituberculatus TaxID=210409 RepID=A0A5B7DUM6_PORTR|nr:hypothetical protein [Portunus trituberculatus]